MYDYTLWQIMDVVDDLVEYTNWTQNVKMGIHIVTIAIRHYDVLAVMVRHWLSHHN